MVDSAPTTSTPPAGAAPEASAAPVRSGAEPPSAVPHLWWLALTIAAIEVTAHFVTQGRVATQGEWSEALAFVRSEWREDDAVVAAPDWADPLVREAAGDLVDRPMAGHSDLAAYGRLWVVSIRGHRAREAPAGEAEVSRDFGHVRVERFALPEPSVLYDLVEHVGEAHVTRRDRDQDLPCRTLQTMGATQGGLQAGPLEGAPRHVCDPGRPWLWVGATTTMDLELRGRRCVSQHAQGPDPITTSYDDVPLGDAIVLYGGLWWERERWRNGGDVEVVVRLDGEEIGRMTHHDGDGWKRMEAAVPAGRRGQRGRVSVEVSAEDPEYRAFCWAGSSRGTP